jgi:hypothetical protein
MAGRVIRGGFVVYETQAVSESSNTTVRALTLVRREVMTEV